MLNSKRLHIDFILSVLGKVLMSIDDKILEEFVAQSFDLARQNDKDNLEIMLNAGLNVDLCNDKGNTLLMLAAYNNSLEVAQMLLKKGADVDKRNDKNQTPLSGVCFKGYYEMAELLIRYGANIDADNGFGLTPLNCAIMFRRNKIVKLLLKHKKQDISLMQKIAISLLNK